MARRNKQSGLEKNAEGAVRIVRQIDPKLLELTPRQKEALRDLFRWEKASKEKYFILGQPLHYYQFY